VYRCLLGSAPGYLASDLQRVSHLNARRRLRSSTTSALVAPRTVRFTIGDRTFPVTAASVWNSLPESVRSSPSLQVFRSRLKSENRTFCPVLQTWLKRLIALTTITWLHCLSLLLRVLVVLGLNATLKFIRPSSSSFRRSSLLEGALQPKIAKINKTPYFGSSGSFKGIDVDTTKKLDTSACCDRQLFHAYQQPFSRKTGQQR